MARAATLTADVRPGVGAWLARDIAVAWHLAARGLACRATSSRLDGRVAVAAYPSPPAPEEVVVCVELRRRFGVVWRFVAARRFPRRRAGAHEHLRGWLAEHG